MKKRGFTLLEVLVAMTILTIIGAALFTIFRQSSELYSKTVAHTRQQVAAREALGLMANELRQARLVQVATAGAPEKRGFWGFAEDASTLNLREVGIYFVAPTSMRPSGVQDLCVIGYWLDGTAPPHDLMRYCLTDADSDWKLLICPTRANLKPNSVKLGLLVRNLTFEYWDATNNNWNTANPILAWQSPSAPLPRAVRRQTRPSRRLCISTLRFLNELPALPQGNLVPRYGLPALR